MIRRSERLTLLAATAAAVAFGWHFADLHAGVNRWGAVSLENLSNGEGVVPMQYRILLPWVAATLRDALGGLDYAEFEWYADFIFTPLVWAATALLMRSITRANVGTVALLALGVLPVLSYHYVLPRASYFYVYDIASVATFTFGLAAVFERKFVPLAVIFIVSTFNRETSAFLVVAYVLVEVPGPSWRAAVPRAAVLTAIWALIKYGLWVRYGDQVDPNYSGPMFKEVIDRNLDALQSDTRTVLHHVTSVFAYLWIPAALLWTRIGNRDLKRCLMVIFPFGALMFYVGLLEEIRIFGELLPLIYVTVVHLALGGSRGSHQSVPRLSPRQAGHEPSPQ